MIMAAYSGDADFVPSASRRVSANIVKAKTTTTLSATPLGQLATFTVTVTRTAPVAGILGIPDGTVQFKNGGTTLATLSLSPTGTTQSRTITLGAGSYNIIGAYSGSSTFDASNSQKVKVTVQP